MRVINDETTVVPLDAVHPHPENVNQGDLGAIHESIKHNGFYGSLVVQRSTGAILAGNHRWLAAKQAKATEIPVTYVDVDDDTARRILLADNRTTRLGNDDPERLSALLQEILNETGTLDGTGYDGDALDELLADLSSLAQDWPAIERNKEHRFSCAYAEEDEMALCRFMERSVMPSPEHIGRAVMDRIRALGQE